MRILVTGSAGFIGFHLASALAAAGHEVTGIDSFSDDYTPELKRARAGELRARAGVATHELDLCDAERLDRLLVREPPDMVVHLAAQPGIAASMRRPRACVRANLEGFANLLEGVRRRRIARFFFASSSSVYGGSTELPYCEEQRADTPVSLYAATKRSNELIAYTYSHLFEIQTIGMRFFTVYGPWGRPDMAPWLFTEQILAGDTIALFNRGELLRDFTYIDDIVEAVVRLVQASALPPYGIYNIGNGRPERVRDFVTLIEELLGQAATLELRPMEPGHVLATRADVSKLEAAIGFAPATPLRHGMARFLDWYRAHPELTRAARRHRAAAAATSTT